MVWYQSLFDERYLRFYPELFDLDSARREVEFIDRALALREHALVLDLGCGFGRHSVPLAAKGYRVTGVDLSAPMLSAARTLANEQGVEVDWVERDMRDLSGLGPFDACVCLYTVFGYFDDATNEHVLQSVHDLLAPSATFLIDVSNPFTLVSRPLAESWREGPFGLRLERSFYDGVSGRVMAERLLVSPDGKREVLSESSVRLYASGFGWRPPTARSTTCHLMHCGLQKQFSWLENPRRNASGDAKSGGERLSARRSTNGCVWLLASRAARYRPISADPPTVYESAAPCRRTTQS
jgi:SAM-dependent methyltransferase